MPCICLPLSEIDKQERLAACSERSDQASSELGEVWRGLKRENAQHFHPSASTKIAHSVAAGYFRGGGGSITYNIAQSHIIAITY